MGFFTSLEVLLAFTADIPHWGINALKNFGHLTSKEEVDLLVAANELASDSGVHAYIHVGSEDDLLQSNGLIKHLHEGDSVAQIISSLSEFASLPTARIDETPMVS